MKRWLNRKRNYVKYCIITVLVAVILCFIPGVKAQDLPSQYPRLANYYLKETISEAEAKILSQWDLIIIGLEVQYNNPEVFDILRKNNLDILILAYVASEEMPDDYAEIADVNHPNYKLLSGIADDWWLRDSSGSQIGYWSGTKMLNVTPHAGIINGKRWNTYLPEFMHTEVMSTGLWNGIYYDNVWQNISWVNNGDIDLTNDHQPESASLLDAAWLEGMSTLLNYSRELEGDEAIIIGNGPGGYYTALNGRLIEEFPSESDGGWSGAMQKYIDVMQNGLTPAIVIVNGKSSSGYMNDYRAMRYILTSTLLNNGFMSFDFGCLKHSDLWWYDEYDTYLGQPLSGAQNISNNNSANLTEGIWRRDFERGIILVNSTDKAQTVDLGGQYEKISGDQDPTVNTGEIVSSVQLLAYDGIILLKRYFGIENASYVNGTLSRAYNAQGNVIRHDFYTNNFMYAKDLKIITQDLDGDGLREDIIAWNSKIQIYNSSGFLITEFYPYSTYYNRGINLAVGELNGDGKMEIVTGTGPGGGPHVRIFNYQGKLINPGFFAYTRHFRGGVNITLGDFNNDGKEEIITGAGYGGGPHVRIFSRFGEPQSGFFAYDKNFRGGVSVAAADVNNDGQTEIITAAGRGGGPHIRIFNKYGLPIMPGFFAFEPSWRNGIDVKAIDMNYDGLKDIIVSKTNN